MNQYEFTLTFRLKNSAESPEKYVDELGVNGCDDAIIGIGKLGSIALNFSRKSQSALKAISTAIKDVNKVIPDATLVEATPDFVGMTDIAEIYGTTRQYIRKVVTSQSKSFPDPVHEGKPSLWHLADVLCWVNVNEPKKSNKQLLELAKLNMQINSYKALLKSSKSSEFSIDFKVKGSPAEIKWIDLIHNATSGVFKATPHDSLKRTRKKTRAA